MIKQVLILASIIILLGSCTAFKRIGSDNRQQETNPHVQKQVKFLDNIDLSVEKPVVKQEAQQNTRVKESKPAKHVQSGHSPSPLNNNIEKATALQLKYALLLNTEVEKVDHIKMFEFIDDWYGTRYRLGGTTKNGIDCSAFTQMLFSVVYGQNLPRTAREQYQNSNRISRTKLREGDLIFFKTRRSISHVGIYLQNNKFVHASTSGGVTISDFFDPYWTRKFAGAGRIDDGSGVVRN